VAQLATAYRQLRRDRESFELFESRVLRPYGKGAIEFILRWNVEIARAKGYEGVEFVEAWKPKEETDAIFTLGLEIYKKLSGENAYQGTHAYDPIEKTPAVPLHKRNPGVPKELSEIVMKMIASRGKRYEVFTEILVEMKKVIGH